MNNKDKKEIYDLFGEAFREVVLPSFEDMDERLMSIERKVGSVEKRMATKSDIDRLERRLVSRENQMDRLGTRVDGHEKRLSKLELKIN